MKAWIRMEREVLCGRCGLVIYRSQPLLEISIGNMKRKMYRCANCEGPAPPDLAIGPPSQQFTKRMKPLKSLAQAWKPYKD